jgi:transcriptional regulator of heat shock response
MEDNTITIEVPGDLAHNLLALLKISKKDYVQALARYQMVKVYGHSHAEYQRMIARIDKVAEDIKEQLTTNPGKGQ